MANEKDEAALIAFGSSETKNDLDESYENINQLSPIQSVNWDFYELVSSLKSCDVDKSNWFKAIIVALDLIRTSVVSKRRFKEVQFVLCTDFKSKLSFSDSNIQTLVNCLREKKVCLNVLGVSSDECEAPNESLGTVLRMRESLDKIRLLSFTDCFSNISDFAQKRHTPRSYKITLDIGDSIHIPVEWIKIHGTQGQRIVYHKLLESEVEEYGAGFVRKRGDSEREGPAEPVTPGNPDIELVTDDARVDTFMGEEVRLSYADLEALKRTSTACFTVIGFTRQRYIHPLMSQSQDMYVVKAQTSDESKLLFSLLVNAVRKAKKVVITRRVVQTNGKTTVGALIPAPEGQNRMYFMKLPFAEWARSAPPVSWGKTTPEQLEATDRFIDSMLLPEDVFEEGRGFMLKNPSFQIGCHILSEKAKGHWNANSQIPDHLQKLFVPTLLSDEETRQQAINEINRLFPVKEVAEMSKRKRKNNDPPKDNSLVLDSLPGEPGSSSKQEGIEEERKWKKIRDENIEEAKNLMGAENEEVTDSEYLSTMDVLDMM